jgi:hypothetical protein
LHKVYSLRGYNLENLNVMRPTDESRYP